MLTVCTSKKKSNRGRLTIEEKHWNQQLAQLRVVIEHINRRLKIFKILSERHRNRHKRFGLRFDLIAGLYKARTQTTLTTFCKMYIVAISAKFTGSPLPCGFVLTKKSL